MARKTPAHPPVHRCDLLPSPLTAAKARAALALAKLDRGHTLVAAPIDGVVGNRRRAVFCQVGDDFSDLLFSERCGAQQRQQRDSVRPGNAVGIAGA